MTVTDPLDAIAARTLATPEVLTHTNGSRPDEPLHTWTPVDLVATASAPPEPPTISGLVYPGRRHLFSGEPEALKSWAAMVLCVEQIHHGNSVAYIDFEMGGRETLARLRDLQLTDTELHEGFIYIEPAEPFWDDLVRSDTTALLEHRQPSLVVIDAFTGALQTHSLDPNKSIDIETFYRTVVDPLRAHGAAVVVLDHLPKDPTQRGRFAIGSERKVGAAEVHLGFEVITPFGRGRIGKAKIVTHKDRPGYLQRPRAAELELRSADTGAITWHLTHPETPEGEQPAAFRPTRLMENVSRYLETRSDPASLNQVEMNVKGKGEFVRKAASFLVEDGYATEETGAHGARLFTTLKPYRESSSSTSSHLVPSSSGRRLMSTSSTSSPPVSTDEVLRDEDEDDWRHVLVPVPDEDVEQLAMTQQAMEDEEPTVQELTTPRNGDDA